MTTRITIDGAGRVVIPKAVRDVLHLGPGDALQLESNGQSITLRPARPGVSLTQKQGIWVLSTGEPMDVSATDEVLNQLRAERDLQNAGFEV